MDVNKNKILLKNNYIKRNKEISLISPRNNNTNKIGLVININNHKDKYNRICNSNDNLKNKSYKKNNKVINEITLNNLERENSLLKKEIEIVKSNLIISDKKEQINKKTIKEIKRMNKEKDNSYKNMINIINEYKAREINYMNKIKQIENEFITKKEELMNEISFYKKELMNKDEIIRQLNNKINGLNERVISLKKIINEKNRILLFLTKKEKSPKYKRTNSINNIFNARTMVSSKSCGNIISKIIEFKGLNNSNIRRHNSKIGLKEILLNNEENNEKDKINNNIIVKKQSYYKKRIPNNNKQFNEKNNILKKYYSNRNINEYNNNSLNYSFKNIEKNINTNLNINLNSNKKKEKSNEQNLKDINEIFVGNDKIEFSLENRNKYKKIKNYSFVLNDLEKHQKQIKSLKEMAKKKKINSYNIIGNNKSKIENKEGLFSKKNNLIETNKNLSNINYISNYSFENIIPSFKNK